MSTYLDMNKLRDKYEPSDGNKHTDIYRYELDR